MLSSMTFGKIGFRVIIVFLEKNVRAPALTYQTGPEFSRTTGSFGTSPLSQDFKHQQCTADRRVEGIDGP